MPLTRKLVLCVYAIAALMLSASHQMAAGGSASFLVQIQPGADIAEIAAHYGFTVVQSVPFNTGGPTYVISGSNTLLQTLSSNPSVRWIASNSVISVAPLDGGDTVLPLDGSDTVLPLDSSDTVLPLGPDISTVPTSTIQSALQSVLETLPSGDTVLPLDGGDTVLPLSQIQAAYQKVASLTVGSPGLILQPAFGKIGYYGAVLNTTGKGVTIVDLNTGVDSCHPALAGVFTYNFVPGEPLSPENCPTAATVAGPGYGHGTAVASLLRILAPEANIWSLRTFSSNGTADVATIYAATVWAVDHGANIINMSFGTTQLSSALSDAVSYATRHGVLVTSAAGNSNSDFVMYPAAVQPALAMASTDLTDKKSPFSNYNVGIDVSAPGSHLVAAYPGNRYAIVWGTSFSSTIVAADGALASSMWASGSRVGMPPGLLRSLIQRGTDDIDAQNPQYAGKLGTGRINMWKTYRLVPLSNN